MRVHNSKSNTKVCEGQGIVGEFLIREPHCRGFRIRVAAIKMRQSGFENLLHCVQQALQLHTVCNGDTSVVRQIRALQQRVIADTLRQRKQFSIMIDCGRKLVQRAPTKRMTFRTTEATILLRGVENCCECFKLKEGLTNERKHSLQSLFG